MPAAVRFHINKDDLRRRVQQSSVRALARLEEDALKTWRQVAPVGQDRPGHKAGTLRDSWFSRVQVRGNRVSLIIGASVRYAIYVELGTGVMAPRAPLRRTAGQVFPLLDVYFKQELARRA
jgi:Bacteriophage HK97-gp10, putative tail-component